MKMRYEIHENKFHGGEIISKHHNRGLAMEKVSGMQMTHLGYKAVFGRSLKLHEGCSCGGPSLKENMTDGRVLLIA